ncbi:MAG: hypothetical protein FWC38_02455 [Proteobacteria bacterium]|nr:hypothetical protein [Pseudomonadota bacterium]MCL2307097.1 hypothetical protein [Pseudomonadota bacterium]
MKNFALGVLFLSACVLSFPVFADGDRIEVRASSSGHPPIGAGWEFLKLNLNRPYDKERYKDSPLEKLFVEIEEILKKRKVEEGWGWMLVDAPFVSIDIELKGKKISLASSHPYKGNKDYSSWPAHTEKQPHQGKLAFDEVYAAIKRYTTAEILIQRE